MTSRDRIDRRTSKPTTAKKIYHHGYYGHEGCVKPRRIHITGASGTGTTTLGAALGRRLGWKHIDADDYYWLPTRPPFQQKRHWKERLELILADLYSAPVVVASGSTIRWGLELEDAYDLIVYLYIPPGVRLQRLRTREVERNGRVNEEFIAWAALYEDGDITVRSRRRVEAWLSERRAPVLRLEGDMTTEARIAAVLAQP
jgi:adenylate kinase family enzyme